jgi:hypothetical protein
MDVVGFVVLVLVVVALIVKVVKMANHDADEYILRRKGFRHGRNFAVDTNAKGFRAKYHLNPTGSRGYNAGFEDGVVEGLIIRKATRF